MKKHVLTAVLLLLTSIAFAQRQTFERITVTDLGHFKNSILLRDRFADSISIDPLFQTVTDRTLPSALAVKTYVLNGLAGKLNITDTIAKWVTRLYKKAGTDSVFAVVGGLPVYAFRDESPSESDPVYTASSWFGTTNNSSNWNTAYGWGDHASAGYWKYHLIDGGNNLGSGAQVFKDTSINKLNFRSITATGGMVATQNANDIAISLPSQTGNNGKYLKTNGTDASWQNVTPSIDTGTISNRPASPIFGQTYYQTDELIGLYIWTGISWQWQPPFTWVNARFTNFTSPATTNGFIQYVLSSGGTFGYGALFSPSLPDGMNGGVAIKFQGGSTTGPSVSFFAGSNSLSTHILNYKLTGHKWTWHQMLKIGAFNSTLANYIMRFGFTTVGNLTGQTDTSGVYFKIGTNDSLYSVTENGANNVTSSTGMKINPGAIFKLVINYTGTQMKFYVNDTLRTTHTNTSSFPDYAGQLGWGGTQMGGGNNCEFISDRIIFYPN